MEELPHMHQLRESQHLLRSITLRFNDGKLFSSKSLVFKIVESSLEGNSND